MSDKVHNGVTKLERVVKRLSREIITWGGPLLGNGIIFPWGTLGGNQWLQFITYCGKLRIGGWT